ncbi:hypothetical protein CCHR01_01351 [Colletotrichum chrysophilum]|uniref:Uncharacterized protein n=1 Tax=Colletotrichum chrysophilum TaxID=1836956 RepID=A0AAD9AZC2_9PEZI|nr:hypothetical protein CCHR01_01351 [Colletotrichum chrysophilum]
MVGSHVLNPDRLASHEIRPFFFVMVLRRRLASFVSYGGGNRNRPAPGLMSDDGALSTGSVSIVVARKDAFEASDDRPSTEIDSAR